MQEPDPKARRQMFHHNTGNVLETWRRRRGAAPLPPRSALPDAAMTPLLPQTFILGESDRGAVLRLSGEGVCDLFGGGLKDRGFASLFREADGPRLAEILRAARRAAAPFVFKAREGAPRADAPVFEFFLGPLAGDPAGPKRWLGHVQALNPRATGPCRARLEAGGFAMAAETPGRPSLRLISLNGARVA